VITVTYYVGIKDKGKIMVSRIAFRNQVNQSLTELTDYAKTFTSLTGTGQDPSIAQANLMRISPRFAEAVRLVYNPIASYDIATSIQGLIAGLFEAVTLIENNIPTDNLTTRVASNVIDRLTTTLVTLNPEWTKAVTTPIFVDIWNGWLNHAKAKKANDAVKMIEAEKLFSDNTMAFAQAFITGVEKQYNPIFF